MAAFATTLALAPAAPKASWIASCARQDKSETRSIRLLKATTSPPGDMKLKANAHATPELNGTEAITYPTLSSSSLEAEKQPTLLDWKPRRPDVNALVDSIHYGQLVHNGLVFQQSFAVRSYEIGADGTSSMEWFMNNLQETALNHARLVGWLGVGFSSDAMSRSNLIWAVTKMHIVVNRYPSWRDVVQIDTWVYPNGKNGMRRDWNVYNKNTGEILAQATSSWVMMNTSTRRLSGIPDDIKVELEPNFNNCVPILEEDRRKLPKLEESTANSVQNGLTPGRFDLDMNQHVNNVKYISWILESCISMLETHELVGLTLEYRKECHMGDVVQSMTAVAKDCIDENRPEFVHVFRLDNGAEIVRGRTTWRPKQIGMHRYLDRGLADNI